nr:TPA_asm: hypothetical protein HUJ06_019634 [Nelumbo nucifera]
MDSLVLEKLRSINNLHTQTCESLLKDISSFGCDHMPSIWQMKAKRVDFIVRIMVATIEVCDEEEGSPVMRELIQRFQQVGLTDLFEEIEAYDDDDAFEEVGHRMTPASSVSIKALKRKRFDIESDLVKTCTICLEDFLEEMEVVKLPCSHVFHKECIVHWLKQSHLCPLCRFQMPVDSTSPTDSRLIFFFFLLSFFLSLLLFKISLGS